MDVKQRRLDEFIKKQHEKIVRYLRATSGPGMHKINEITQNIYITNQDNANDVENLKGYRIKTVFNLGDPRSEKELRRYKRRKIDHIQVNISDSENQDISSVLDYSYNVILESIQNKHKILVHCNSGVSRAPAIVIGYLLRRQYRISFEKYKKIIKPKKRMNMLRTIINPTNLLLMKIIKFIKQSRPCIEPNAGFVWQLLMFEQFLKRQYAVPIQTLFNEYKHDDRKKSKKRKSHEDEDEDEDSINLFGSGNESASSSSHSSEFESDSSGDNSLEEAFENELKKPKNHKKTKKPKEPKEPKKSKKSKKHKIKSDIKITNKDTLADVRAMDISSDSDGASTDTKTHEIIKATAASDSDSSDSYDDASSDESVEPEPDDIDFD